MFTDAHSASAVCTPSRYALLTGQSPLQAENGKIKKDAPPAHLYDLEKDVNQTTNLYKQ